jgi:NADH-quinone oxidoreductase subunit J
MVLFLFVVMMLDINIEPLRQGFMRYLPVGVLIAAMMATVMWWVLDSGSFEATAPSGKPADYSNTEELGRALYTDYLYPFEIAGALLLVAIIAAIALTLRRRPGTKYQNPATQMRARKSDRLRIIKMDAEKK